MTTPTLTAPALSKRTDDVALEQLDGVGLDQRVAQQLSGEAVDHEPSRDSPSELDGHLHAAPDADVDTVVTLR